jgi:thiol-disulfide isomerase/thioredoxin
MRLPLITALIAGTVGASLAATVGQTYEQVLAEKGPPTSHLEAAAVQILTYPDAVIKFRDHVVVAIKAPDTRPSPGPPPAALPPRITPVPPAEAQKEYRGGPVSWTTDLNGALDQAKAENRHILLFFTGSDWCVWCKRLNDEILSTPEFAQFAQDKLALVELDFPHHKAQPNSVRVQNRTLATRYNITGFPTVIVLDSTGKAVARLGYQPGGPGPFVSQLRALGD